MAKQTGSKLGKEYLKAVYHHPAYLTSMQSTSREMPVDEAQAGIKIAELLTTWYTDEITPVIEIEELKSLLMRLKKDSETVGLKVTIQKNKISSSGPNTSWQLEREKKQEQAQILLYWAPKSLHTVTSVMTLKDTCSLEENVWQT